MITPITAAIEIVQTEPISAFEIHQVMCDKGFWSRPMPKRCGLTWAQLAHVFMELTEWNRAGDTLDAQEEAADVCIVIFDLLGNEGMDARYDKIRPHAASCMELLAHVMQVYRKHGEIDHNVLCGIVAALKDYYGSDALYLAIKEKMEKNMARPARYGTDLTADALTSSATVEGAEF